MMAKVRWIKTTGELDLIQQGAHLLDEAYLEVFPTLGIGDTEREIHSRLVQSCIQKGANWAHGILNSSRNTVIYGGESAFSFQKGDVVRNDYVAYYQGYPGHQSRPVIVGPPSDKQKQTYQTVLNIYRRTIDQCRPGVKASTIYHFAADAFRQAGFTQQMALAGHGVGAWWHQQQPYLVPTDNTILEAGMVLALEPHVNYWHLQEMILITDNEPQLLSDRFDINEMLVVG